MTRIYPTDRHFATTYHRPPICPPDEHDLICHCGSDADHSGWEGHAPVVMGCHACQRTMEAIEAEQPGGAA